MAYAVGYAVDDLGFYHIPHGPINMTKKDSLTALIKVNGGQLTEEELVSHFKRLVSTKFDWDAHSCTGFLGCVVPIKGRVETHD